MITSLPTSTPTSSESSTTAGPAEVAVIRVNRRRLDTILIGIGVLAMAAFAIAGSLLTWGSNFSTSYVRDELSSQHVVFPTAEALKAEGRADLASFGGKTVDTGVEAQAYAKYIGGHLDKIAGGSTFAELSVPQRAAQAEVAKAKAANADAATLAPLQAKADAFTGQRNSLFQGETLRGLLLTAYAWSTVGRIASYAAIGAFVAALLMASLVALGLIHRTTAS